MPDFSIAPDGHISEEPVHTASQEVTTAWPQFEAQPIELNMLLLRCFRMIATSTEAAVERHGLTLSRASTLSRLYLAREQGLTIGKIATLQDMTHANASKLVEGLVKDGLVQKTTNPDDARSMNATLTPKGEELAQIVGPLLYGAIDEAWSGLSALEQRVLSHLLSKLRLITLAGEGDVESWLATIDG